MVERNGPRNFEEQIVEQLEVITLIRNVDIHVTCHLFFFVFCFFYSLQINQKREMEEPHGSVTSVLLGVKMSSIMEAFVCRFFFPSGRGSDTLGITVVAVTKQ